MYWRGLETLLWWEKGKNPKGTTEGRRNYFQQNPLANSAYTFDLWCFIPKKCLPFPKIIVELKKLWVKGINNA